MFKFVTAGIFALSAIVAANPAQASLNDQFVCDPAGDGEHLVIMSSRDTSKASVHYSSIGENGEGATVAHTPLTAAYVYPETGSKYTGGEYIFYTTNTAAMLVYGVGTGNEGHVGCRVAGEPDEDGAGEATTDAAGGGDAIAIRAKSWGGKLRGGPGVEYSQTGSLHEGARVTLLQNTGVKWNGYDWFRIRTADGKEAFQWGGILCSDALHVIGIYEKCL